MRTSAVSFALGSLVYLRVNSERKGLVTGHLIRPNGVTTYLVSWDEPIDEKEHQACELSDERIMDLPGMEGET